MNPEREERERLMTAPKKMIVTVDPKAYWKMSHWAAQGGKLSREFIAFARTQMIDQRIYITDTYLVKHEGDSTGVEADDADVNRLIFELDKAGVPADEGFGCWVHSHPGVGDSATYLSGTDERNIEEIMTGDRMVSIVFDSKGEHPYCRVDFREPRWSVEAEIVIWPYISAEEVEQATAEFKEKSRSKSYSAYEGYKGGEAWSRASLPKSKYDKDPVTKDTWWEREAKVKERKAKAAEKAVKRSKGKDQAPKKVASAEDGPYADWQKWYDETEASLNDVIETMDDGESERQLELAQEHEKELDEICSEVLEGKVDCQEAVARSQTLGLSTDQATDELEFRLNMTIEDWESELLDPTVKAENDEEANAIFDEVCDAIVSLDDKFTGEESSMTDEESILEDLLLTRDPLRKWFKSHSKRRKIILLSVSDGTYTSAVGIGQLEASGITGHEAKAVLDAYLSRTGYEGTGDTVEVTVADAMEKPTTALALVDPNAEKKTSSIDDEITQRRIGTIAMNVFAGNCVTSVALHDLQGMGISVARSEQILQARLNKLACSVSKGEAELPPLALKTMRPDDLQSYFAFAEEVAKKIVAGEINLLDGAVVMEAAGYDPESSTLTLDRLVSEKRLSLEYDNLNDLLDSYDDGGTAKIGIENN